MGKVVRVATQAHAVVKDDNLIIQTGRFQSPCFGGARAGKVKNAFLPLKRIGGHGMELIKLKWVDSEIGTLGGTLV
jgi:hypothetical protein